MSEPPIDERYELAAVKESLTADERKAAEHAYTVSAFDYEKAPVGSRDWTLFWSGWCARATQPVKAQPPCGADGVVPEKTSGDAPFGLSINGADGWARGWNDCRAMLASQPAAPVAPAAVAVAVAVPSLEAVLAEYERQTRALPAQDEILSRGCSTFNWQMSVIRDLRKIAASQREGCGT